MFRISVVSLFTVIASLGLAVEPTVPFPRTTIDVGMVVSDIDTAVAFYTQGIGFKQLEGFQVNAELAKAAGLAGKPTRSPIYTAKFPNPHQPTHTGRQDRSE